MYIIVKGIILTFIMQKRICGKEAQNETLGGLLL